MYLLQSPEQDPIECINVQKQVYCKESTHVIMEAGKSQAIQGKLASWRSREVNCVVPVWMLAGSKPTKR